MENTIYIGLSRQVALRQSMNTLANNIANINTPGYRGSKTMFSEHISRPDKKVQEPLSQVIDRAQFIDTSAGGIKFTGATFDVALEGPGFFGVRANGQDYFTSAGNFTINKDH